MDYRYLRAFLQTARHRSFSKAAQELRIAQSAVSRQIRCLEESIGQQLIVRSPQAMVLTELGQELYLALADFDRNVQRLTQVEERPEVRVGVLHGVLETWLTGVIAHDGVASLCNFVIEVDRPERLLQGLLAREIEVAITNENLQTELVTSLKLFDEELVLISRDALKPEHIHQRRWITYAADDWLHRVYGPREPIEYLRVNSMTAILRLVRSGVGIAIVPTHLLDDRSGLVIQTIPLDRQPSIFVSTLNYTYLPPSIRPVLDALKKAGSVLDDLTNT